MRGIDRSVECRGIRAPGAHARCCVVLGIGLLLAGCPSGQVRQAEYLAAEGRLDDAVELYRKASRQDPFNERLQEQLAEATPYATPYATPGAADRIPSVANSLNVDLLSRPSNSAYGILENHRFIGQMPLAKEVIRAHFGGLISKN